MKLCTKPGGYQPRLEQKDIEQMFQEKNSEEKEEDLPDINYLIYLNN